MEQADQHNSASVFVLVPSYNHAPFIERCLKSIIKQTHQPTKLLVIDDGSKDNSPRIIEHILKDCPFPAELIARTNRGLCATLNEGFISSSGKYFAYLGSDDLWLPRFLEKRVELLQNRPKAVLAFGHAFLINDTDAILESSTDWLAYENGDERQMLLRGIAPVSSTVCYRRSALEKVRWNENSRLEDYELYLKLSSLGEFAFDPQILAAWRQHGYNTSSNMPLMLQEVIEAQRRNAALLNIDNEELRKIEMQVKFRFAEDFVRRGLKTEALKLALENWRGAESATSLFRIALRLLLPINFIKWRRNFLQKQMATRYGTIEV